MNKTEFLSLSKKDLLEGLSYLNKNAQSKKLNFWNKLIFKYILIPLIVAIMGGIAVYRLTNGNMTDNIFNVTSNNQQGGITAGQVNIGIPRRHLTDNLRNQLEEFKDKKINITTAFGDNEAITFGYEIKDYLFQNGFDVASFGQTMFANSQPKGLTAREEKNGSITLIVGSK